MKPHFHRTTRRTILAGMAATLAPVARAQQRSEIPRIGVLMAGSADDPDGQADAQALREGLRALHWQDGATLHIEWRWAEGDPMLFERFATELVALAPELIVAQSNAAVDALRRRASTIPVVFVMAIDPVGCGLVESLAHPGGTITGFSSYDLPIAGKSLALLSRLTPPVTHAVAVYNAAAGALASLMLRAIEDAAPSVAITVSPASIDRDTDAEVLMASMAREDHGGLLLLPSPFLVEHRAVLIALAARYRLPALYPSPSFVTDGGLMAYAIDRLDLTRRAASYVDRILKGAKPADLPVQVPAKFDLAVNLNTARALGITIAPELLATANEVIE